MKPDDKIQELHATYVAVSGMDVALRFNRESSWMEFMRSGFTKADLEAVLKRLLALVKTGDRRPECLKFSNVVEGLDRFEEELAMIKAEAKGIKAVEPKLGVWDIERIIEAKQSRANLLEDLAATRDAFGLHWQSDNARSEHRKLNMEIRNLRSRIASLA